MAWVHPLFDTSGRLHTYTFYTTAIKGGATDAVIEFEQKGILIQPTPPRTSEPNVTHNINRDTYFHLAL